MLFIVPNRHSVKALHMQQVQRKYSDLEASNFFIGGNHRLNSIHQPSLAGPSYVH